jgi:putative spermidine/putrescine transport system permease protein
MKMMKKAFYILLLPGLLIISIFLVIPILSTILPTFFDGGNMITIKSYTDFFTDPYYIKIFLRTIKLALITVIICMFLGVPTAYFISRSKKKIRGMLIVFAIFPMLTNSVVRAFSWMAILGKNGVINDALMKLGLIAEPLKLLYTEGAIVVGTVYLFLPIMITTVVGVMENIDSDIYEAAESLGSSKIEAFFQVIFPLSLPGIIVGNVLVFTGAASAYNTAQMLGGNSNMVLSTLIYQQAMSLGNWETASVISAVMIVSSILIMAIMNSIASKINERGV